ncbi:MAG: hypothetical protein D6694_14735 [Gammaproteobacteria bacterium]|nr:MAG: hypothetical protein D6694_14735 [Gammaproteobacteria bacterium]
MTREIHVWRRAVAAVRGAVERGEALTEAFWEKLQAELLTIEKLSEDEVQDVLSTIRADWHALVANAEAVKEVFQDWWAAEKAAVKEYLEDWLALIADPTKAAWWSAEALGDAPRLRRTGHWVSIGRWQCTHCGELLTFRQPGRLPPCPRCHEAEFRLALPPIGSDAQ